MLGKIINTIFVVLAMALIYPFIFLWMTAMAVDSVWGHSLGVNKWSKEITNKVSRWLDLKMKMLKEKTKELNDEKNINNTV